MKMEDITKMATIKTEVLQNDPEVQGFKDVGDGLKIKVVRPGWIGVKRNIRSNRLEVYFKWWSPGYWVWVSRCLAGNLYDYSRKVKTMQDWLLSHYESLAESEKTRIHKEAALNVRESKGMLTLDQCVTSTFIQYLASRGVAGAMKTTMKGINK